MRYDIPRVFIWRIMCFLQGMAARVTTVDKYDIYHTSDVDINSAFSEASPRPLMTITTTMKEVIQFSPYADTPTGRKVHLSFAYTVVLCRDGPIQFRRSGCLT